ncbi:hypothetical protein [Lysobacter auxotrophicus]|uniref:Nucleotide-binding protein n=1 Tax=Lysobacter auxotrophicus TaxID=2992573 RepID=A0ABM8DHN6_9GAMM|nr:hypothetical protein [Lysobacter auxotrophicus]BDU18103.1 nucleotide-binding protein [Lysobacter auxotrophicus]
MRVFWSWQSDRPVAVTRNFIQSALEDALHKVASDLALSPADRPELDHDTKGEAGLVEIVKTIFDKIERADAFVADVTPIAETGQGKKVPNPNVMIELGHAMKVLGHEPIILVANTVYGGKPEDLPFDLRHRRGAITYRLRTTDGDEVACTVREQLVADLTAALQVNLQSALSRRDQQVEFARHPSRNDDPSTWLQPEERIQHGNFFGESGEHVLEVHGTTRSYFRMMPAGWTGKKPTRQEVRDLTGPVRLSPLGRWTNGDGGANALGSVSVGLWRGVPGITHTATQWFDKTGEIWAFDAGVTSLEGDRNYLGYARVLKDWSTMLERSLAFYQHFGASSPYRVEVGVGGLEGVYWPGQFQSDRTLALDPYVGHSREARDWGSEAQLVFLTSAFNKLTNAFGRPSVNEAAIAKILAQVPA